MVKFGPAGNDLDLGTFAPAKIRVTGKGWYNAYDNSTTVTLVLALDSEAFHRRASTHRVIVTLGVTTNVTCTGTAKGEVIGLGATMAAGDYLLTFVVGPAGVNVIFQVVD